MGHSARHLTECDLSGNEMHEKGKASIRFALQGKAGFKLLISFEGCVAASEIKTETHNTAALMRCV
jgi:hypothetical protein